MVDEVLVRILFYWPASVFTNAKLRIAKLRQFHQSTQNVKKHLVNFCNSVLLHRPFLEKLPVKILA